MCGVFGFDTGPGPQEIAKRLKLKYQPGLFDKLTSYKFTPRSTVPTVSKNSPNAMIPRIWWLAPIWAKDPYKIKFATFNARSEGIEKKPAFRHAWAKNQRCLIPATYFVEWETTDDGEKLPYKVKVKDQDMFSIAGIYEDIEDAEGQMIRTCTMLTTHSLKPLSTIHQRQPVILNEDQYEEWLNKDTSTEQAMKMLEPRKDLVLEKIDPKFNKTKTSDLDQEPDSIV